MNFGSVFSRKKKPGDSGAPKYDPDVDPGPWKGSLFCRPGGLPGGVAPDVGVDEAVGATTATATAEYDGMGIDLQKYVAVGPTAAAATAEAFDMPSADDIRPTPAGHGNDAESLKEACVVLDTNAAIVYGEHADRDGIGKIGLEFRTLLCGKSIERVVTPTVLGEVRRQYQCEQISKYALNRVEALAIEGGRLYEHRDRHVEVIKKRQRGVANDPRSETATRWLAAKRLAYQKAHKADYGSPVGMDDCSRRFYLGRLCDMAASDRMIMAEAVCVSSLRKEVVLLSTDADMTLFEDALVMAAKRCRGGGSGSSSGGKGDVNIRVAVIPMVPSDKHGR